MTLIFCIVLSKCLKCESVSGGGRICECKLQITPSEENFFEKMSHLKFWIPTIFNSLQCQTAICFPLNNNRMGFCELSSFLIRECVKISDFPKVVIFSWFLCIMIIHSGMGCGEVCNMWRRESLRFLPRGSLLPKNSLQRSAGFIPPLLGDEISTQNILAQEWSFGYCARDGSLPLDAFTLVGFSLRRSWIPS